MLWGMKMTSKFTSAGGYYYEGGYRYYHSEGSYEQRADGKCFMHYYGNMGNLVQEITEREYNEKVAALRAKDGKVTAHWSGVTHKHYEETRDVDVYSWDTLSPVKA